MDKLAEMLETRERTTGGDAQRTRFRKSTESPPPPTLAELGLTKKESALAQKFHALPAKTKEKIKSGVSTLSAVMAETDRVAKVVRKMPKDQFERDIKMPLPSARKIAKGNRNPVWERLAKLPKDKFEEPLPVKGKRKSRYAEPMNIVVGGEIVGVLNPEQALTFIKADDAWNNMDAHTRDLFTQSHQWIPKRDIWNWDSLKSRAIDLSSTKPMLADIPQMTGDWTVAFGRFGPFGKGTSNPMPIAADSVLAHADRAASAWACSSAAVVDGGLLCHRKNICAYT